MAILTSDNWQNDEAYYTVFNARECNNFSNETLGDRVDERPKKEVINESLAETCRTHERVDKDDVFEDINDCDSSIASLQSGK